MNDPGPSSSGRRHDTVVDISVEASAWEAFPEAPALAKAAIDAALQTADLELAPGAEVSLLLCDDAFIKGLNAQWRGQDKPTNVLSFPAGPDPAVAPLLGDIAIAYETMAREAADEGKSLGAHFSHLVVHGVLHLLGYDHEIDAEAETMEDIERKSLACLGIDDPYRLSSERDAEPMAASPHQARVN